MQEKINIAVAEDIDILRKDICKSIKECSQLNLIGEASCGRELVEIVKKNKIDVVLTDIEMDDRYDGIRAAKKITEISPDTAIVFLTIHEDDETIFKAFSTSENIDYVLKTEAHEQIIQRIIDVHEGKINISARIASKLKSEFYRLRHSEASLLYIINIIGELTPTEKELIKLLLENKKVAQIAKERNVEIVTVKSQISSLLKKFNMKRTKQIINLIRELNLEYLFNKNRGD